MSTSEEAHEITERVEQFHQTVAQFESDPGNRKHAPTDDLTAELNALARKARMLTPISALTALASHTLRRPASYEKLACRL
jgi:hypothetical protein